MGSQKPKLVRKFLVERGWAGVVLSDVDTTWLRNPEPYLALHPTADVFISTDCLSHKARMNIMDCNRRKGILPCSSHFAQYNHPFTVAIFWSN